MDAESIIDFLMKQGPFGLVAACFLATTVYFFKLWRAEVDARRADIAAYADKALAIQAESSKNQAQIGFAIDNLKDIVEMVRK